jgi:flavodoxin I
MKVLVVYDSVYGNTEQIAKAIAGAIPAGGAKALRVGEANLNDLAAIDLLIIGSPVQGGRATPALQEFLDKIPATSLKTVKAASFDTRLSTKWVGIFGYAAGKIADSLKEKGATLLAAPQPFYVKGKEGPVKEGELKRAAAWARGISVSSGK